ncbi:hypothetical protein HS7_11480 [Sulfolobales archaeon HS-7]|nr:hypothetical protein HS7_11480 [Sulfolobales archaeon HS-7]
MAILPFFPFDDYLYLSAGVARSPLAKLNLYVVIAKLAKSGVEISLELLGIGVIHLITGISPVYISLLTLVIFIILGVVLLKIDWEKWYYLIVSFLQRTSK